MASIFIGVQLQGQATVRFCNLLERGGLLYFQNHVEILFDGFWRHASSERHSLMDIRTVVRRVS
jgi:hypothetical protein